MKLFFLSLAFLLVSCATGGQQVVRTYDLGEAAPQAKLPALRSVIVRAPMPYDGVDMFYRLAWKDGAEIAAYSQSRWAAPPAELLRRQLVRALPASSAAPCVLEVELEDFSQVFSSKDASEAKLELRAVLSGRDGRAAMRGVSVVERASEGSAAGGAAAFARATDRVVAQLSSWIATQPDCRS